MLFIIKSTAAIEQALKLANTDDVLLLIENAVYAGVNHHRSFFGLKERKVYALHEDLQARGIENRLSPSVLKVNFDGFVQLTTEQVQSITLE
ncbi:sulfurtransferase complex subunit TusB [Vibrio sp. FNV 38]|nr:sulfurtransferase complex subunit TusB [Vibrio sp. FNV 38]